MNYRHVLCSLCLVSCFIFHIFAHVNASYLANSPVAFKPQCSKSRGGTETLCPPSSSFRWGRVYGM